MKKLLAAVLCIITVLTLSVSVFAEESPQSDKVVQVTVFNAVSVDGIAQVGKAQVIEKGEVFVVKADAAQGKLDSWSFYKIENNNLAAPKVSAAVLGQDYDLVNCTNKDESITVKPYTTIVVCGNYNGMITDPTTGELKKSDSPATGNSGVIICTIVMLGAAVIAFGAKKQFSK